MDPGALRREAEAFLTESRREWYLGGSGQKDEVEMAAVFARHPGLFRRETLGAVSRAREAAGDAAEARRWAELAAFLTTGIIRSAVAGLADQATNFESRATVRAPGGGEMPYRQSAVALINEADRGRREALEAARMAVVAEKNRFLVPIHQQTHALARALGHEGYLGMMAAIKPYPLSPVREEMQRFLRRTERLYAGRMAAALETVGAPPGRARRHDAQHLFRGGAHDALFPAEGLVPAAEAFCAGMGLDLRAGGRVRLDLEPRPRKSPRAFCAAVDVPGEVYLVIRPRGGYDDYRAFWHELGHALHFAHADPGAPLEERRLGDNSVTEAYAMLFDHLLLDPAWLAGSLGAEGEARAAFLRHHALFELYMLRRYAAKIDYELGLHAGADLTGRPRRYADLLGEATGVEYPGESYLDDVDPFFYCANYLRAWMLQAQLAARLRERFGRAWWRSRESGAFLRGLWALGQAEDGDAVSRRLGFGALTTGPLAEEMEGLLEGGM